MSVRLLIRSNAKYPEGTISSASSQVDWNVGRGSEYGRNDTKYRVLFSATVTVTAALSRTTAASASPSFILDHR